MPDETLQRNIKKRLLGHGKDVLKISNYHRDSYRRTTRHVMHAAIDRLRNSEISTNDTFLNLAIENSYTTLTDIAYSAG